MQKFENTPANFSTPFSIVSDSGDLIHGPAVLTVKDDFGKCKFIFKVVRVHKMEIGGPYKIPDLVSNLCIGSSFLTTINTVAGVRVYLYIQHTAAGDLEITLHAPNNGPVVTLSDNNGGLGDNFGAGLGFVNPGYGWTPTVFDDDASTLITSGTPPYSGWYQPQSPLTALVNLSGNQANGTWNICFNDTAAQDDGYFIGAAIELVDQF
jgi:subtilisin-like proprotein convertase family protein